jgi:hypothetical protein
VLDLKDPSQIPPICEPLFSTVKATVELFPVMTRDELQKGLEQAGEGRVAPTSHCERGGASGRASGLIVDCVPGCRDLQASHGQSGRIPIVGAA